MEGFVEIIVLFFTGITGKVVTETGGTVEDDDEFNAEVENDEREDRFSPSATATVSVSFRCTRRRARAFAAAVAPDDTSIPTVGYYRKE